MGQEDSPREGKGYSIQNYWAAMREAWVWSLGWGDPLEEDMAAHSSICSLKVPIKRGASRLKESDTMMQLSTPQCISFSVKYLMISFMLFLNGIFFFLTVNLRVLYFFQILPIFPVNVQFVIITTDSFTKQKVLILMMFNLSFSFLFFFFSYGSHFDARCKNSVSFQLPKFCS